METKYNQKTYIVVKNVKNVNFLDNVDFSN